MLPRHWAICCLLLFATPSPARADSVVIHHEFTQEDASAADAALGAQGDVDWLVVQGGADAPRHLLTLETPAPPHAVVELRGMVRARDVSPPAQLVLWLDYGEGHRYRVVTDGTGPIAPLAGSFEARAFRIPYAGREGDTLERISLELELPGRGTVAVGPVRLVALDQRGIEARMRPWFRMDDVWGLFMPLGLALLGAMLGVGLLAIVGRLRELALLLLKLGASVGALAMSAAGFAMSQAQPSEVYLPLLGAGGITLVFALLLYGPTRRRFRTAEENRMPEL